MFEAEIAAVGSALASIPSVEIERAAYRAAHEHSCMCAADIAAAATADTLIRARAEHELAGRAETARRDELAAAVSAATLPSRDSYPLAQGRGTWLQNRDTGRIVEVAATIANHEFGCWNKGYDRSYAAGKAEPETMRWEIASESPYFRGSRTAGNVSSYGGAFSSGSTALRRRRPNRRRRQNDVSQRGD